MGCRTRFEKLLGNEERGKRAKKRSDEFITKVIGADDLKRNRKRAKVGETQKAPEWTPEGTPVEPDSDADSEGEFHDRTSGRCS